MPIPFFNGLEPNVRTAARMRWREARPGFREYAPTTGHPDASMAQWPATLCRRPLSMKTIVSGPLVSHVVGCDE